MKFSLSKKELANFLAAEAVSASVGLPFVGASFSYCLIMLNSLHEETEFVRIPDRAFGPSDPFLNQHPTSISGLYSKETSLAGRLLYREEVCFIDRLISTGRANIDIETQAGAFKMAQFDNISIEALRAKGFKALEACGKYRHDSDTIRVSHYRDDGKTTTLLVQKAFYKQQAQSNLILDYAGEEKQTIRKYLLDENPGHLPSLNDQRLVNSLGITILVFYRDYKSRLVPFLVPRTRQVAVLNRGLWHDSASGAAQWPYDSDNTPETFDDYIMDDLYAELRQEIGLEPNDLTGVYPLAFCREFIRAGKPQLFMIGFTDLSYFDLIEKMKTARVETLPKLGEPDEIFPMSPFRIPPEVNDARDAARDLGQSGYDPQCAASLYYAHRFFKLAAQQNPELIP